MRSISGLRMVLFVMFAALSACGGGGGGSSSSSSSSGGTPPPVRTLFVATQPSGAAPSVAFATQPVVQVRSNGVTDAADNTTVVTVAIVAGTGAAGAALTGTTTATAVAGVATFTNLGINTAGTGYQLRFTATNVAEATSSTFAITAPPVSQVTFAIDSSQDVRPISRFIYGMNGWDPAVRPANLALSRSGGNRMTAYNWETNDSNAGADYQNQNDTFLGGGAVPNGAVKPGLEAARAAGAGMLVTIPLIGYVSADHNGGGDVALSGPNYLATRFRVSSPRKGAAFVMAPVTTDGFVYQDEYVQFPRPDLPGRIRGGEQSHHDQPRQRARSLAKHTRAFARRRHRRIPGGHHRHLRRDGAANRGLR